MEGTIQISIETDFLRDAIIPLTKLGCTYRNVGKKTVWAIPIEKITQVEAIIGQKIELYQGQTDEFQKLFKTITPEPERKAGIEITEVVQNDKIVYTIHTINKNGIISKTHSVSKHVVDNLNEIIENTDAEWFKDAKIPVRIIQERMVKRYGFKQFNNSKGIFDKTKFFGNREYYFHYFYYPLKVLVNKGLVIHHRNGFVSKVPKTTGGQVGKE